MTKSNKFNIKNNLGLITRFQTQLVNNLFNSIQVDVLLNSIKKSPSVRQGLDPQKFGDKSMKQDDNLNSLCQLEIFGTLDTKYINCLNKQRSNYPLVIKEEIKMKIKMIPIK